MDYRYRSAAEHIAETSCAASASTAPPLTTTVVVVVRVGNGSTDLEAAEVVDEFVGFSWVDAAGEHGVCVVGQARQRDGVWLVAVVKEASGGSNVGGVVVTTVGYTTLERSLIPGRLGALPGLVANWSRVSCSAAASTVPRVTIGVEHIAPPVAVAVMVASCPVTVAVRRGGSCRPRCNAVLGRRVQ